MPGARERAQLPRPDCPQRQRSGPTKIGVVLLSDGAGEVAAIGEGVTRVKIGDRIAGCFHPRWFGGPIKSRPIDLLPGLAEYAVEEAVALPSHLRGAAHCQARRVALTGRLPLEHGDLVSRQANGVTRGSYEK
jgi:NADPH:quinone reductase-like Zn-dependent oxidoreductase